MVRRTRRTYFGSDRRFGTMMGAGAVVVAMAAMMLSAACSSAENATPESELEGGTASTIPEAPRGSSASEGGSAAQDAGIVDGARRDADAADPRGEILGTFAGGACGVVAAELVNAAPTLHTNGIVFVAGESYVRPSLSPGGQRIYDTPNAGGSSTESEVMSFELLRYCEGAALVKTETEIDYEAPSAGGGNAITDILVEIAGKKVGVSVTRAYRPPSQMLTDESLRELLVRKLESVKRSSERVLPGDKWVKQILHVFAVDKAASDAVARVWATIDTDTRADTIVLVSQTTGGGFVYCDPDPPLGSECR